MGNVRKAEKLIEGKWVEIDFKDIKEGDLVRLFNPDGTSVKDEDSNTDFKALSDAFLNKDGILSFET